ncbi:substrate-binding domain-containing protein [Caballeronia sp. BR00000012568055]|uniref:substrate-binding domain-containing protein n=1 Tax=Caballeronia sp. BR00000012568055 TaxID=2918761 RepID=UPI0023F8089C|nr:substrate-binding domain-containing protein [Caballeronia sp. BR00000012568055]
MPDMSITGISSMATRQVLADLADAYTLRTGQRVAIKSVGGVAALRCVEDGKVFDIVVLASNALDKLAHAGRIDNASRVSLARSGVSVAVKAGARHPSIQSEADVRQAVLVARSIGYSTGPSGAHLMRVFERWGILNDVASRIVQAPPGVAVGTLIARSEVELGFQQTSELIGLDGIDVLGPLPAEIQALTVFQGAICTNARFPERARELLAFMSAPEADEVKRSHGMEPVR